MELKETDLYFPVKAWLEKKGFEVQAEVGDIDVYGIKRKGGSELTVAVELKRQLSLNLLLQAVDRLSSADLVYIALPKAKGISKIKKICNLLGIGILAVDGARVFLYQEAPESAKLKKNKIKTALLDEFHSRRLCVNIGGSKGKIMTSYRENALRIAFRIDRMGEISYRELRERGIFNPQSYLYKNPYGWFESTTVRGVYQLSEKGKADLGYYMEYRDQLDDLS